MIFNRTQEDVNNAIKIREEKIKKFISLTDEELAILERGIITINTLNRIEDKQEELKNLFEEAGYNLDLIIKKWEVKDFFTELDWQNWFDNFQTIKENIPLYDNMPEIPNATNLKIDYKIMNDIEKFLYLVEEIYEKIKSMYVYSGTIYSGQGVD